MNSPTPLISVITSFFNEERFLKETIESVIGQEYWNWELLLIDDGSADASTDIAKEFAAKHPDRIIYLEHPGHINKGLSSSRNLALQHARGDLIALLDADDVWLKQKLKRQAEIFDQQPEAGMLCEASKYWHSWNPDAVKSDIVIQVGCDQDKLYQSFELTRLLYPLGNGAAPCPSAIVLRRSALENIGGFDNGFTGERQSYEDQAFLSKIYLKEKVYVSSDCNNLYRQRAGSLVDKHRGQYRRVRKYFLEWLQRYLSLENIRDKNIDKLLNRALLPYRYPVLYSVLSALPYSLKRFIKKLSLIIHS